MAAHWVQHADRNCGLIMRQELPHAQLSHHEEAEPAHPHHDPGSKRHRAHSLRAVWCVLQTRYVGEIQLTYWADFGKEKKLPLKGLDDKAIESKVNELVSSSA